MQRELGKEGLVVISLSIDEPEGEEAALAFLKRMGARFPNYLLADTEANVEKYQEELPANAPPMAHVFDRSGKKVKTFDNPEEAEVEKFVRSLLQSK